MMVHVELALLALFAALYVYDSALLLHSNEAVLVQCRKGRWIAGFGSARATLRGLELYLPNPLLPTRPMVRLSWQYEGSKPARGKVVPVVRREQFRVLVPLVWSHFACSFVVLPLALFAHWGDLFIALAFALIYANVLLLALVLWWRRRALGLSGRQLASVVFDIAVCPPFALNLIRRLSLRIPVGEDFVQAARRLQKPADWELTKAELRSRLSQELQGEEPDAPRAQALRAQCESLS